MKVFTEEQKFRQPIVSIGLIVAFIAAIVAIAADWENIDKGNFGEKLGALSGIIIILLVILLFINLKLKTRVDEKGVFYQFAPFHLTLILIPWNEITSSYIRKYNAIFEYGGWGMKFNFFKKKGKSYTTSGNIGLQLELKNGRKILIGTQKENELQRVLNTYKHKLESNEK